MQRTNHRKKKSYNSFQICSNQFLQHYAGRYRDHEIRLHVPYSQVKTIFLDRFHRRLETEKSVTVPGRTLETAAELYPQHSVEIIKYHSR
jgi:hypothetical protein